MDSRALRAHELLRADRAAVDRAAAWLRHDAVEEQYAGFREQERAFALAGLLDVLARHLDELDDGVRRALVRASRDLVGDRVDDPRRRRTRRR